MTAETGIGIVFAAMALLLLGRDLRHTWHDPWRRPVSLLVEALLAVLFIGTLAGRTHPSPGWLAVPATVLAWEAVRGWRRTPRCHLWEGGVAAFAAALVFALFGLSLYATQWTGALLGGSAIASLLGVALLWQSRRREPRPWRAGDPQHYERRQSERN